MIRTRCLYNINAGKEFHAQKANQKSPPNPALCARTLEPIAVPPEKMIRSQTAYQRIVGNQQYFETICLKDGRKFLLPAFSFVLVEE